jgi:hypothetical protein
MELVLDTEETIGLQSQSSEMIVEEMQTKEVEVAVLEKPNIENQPQEYQAAKIPVQAERRSTRNVGNGTPMLEKAEKLKASKNVEGTSRNPFTILQKVDNNHLAKVAAACNVVLGEMLVK